MACWGTAGPPLTVYATPRCECANASDPAVQQFVLHVNNEKPPNERFVIVVLDSTHLFIKEDAVPELKERLNQLMDENTYKIMDAS